jgi:dephospho-CoA kinase
MLVVGLTGGIGSGKSTVSALLEKRGAVVLDADRIAREVVSPGGPAYQPVVDRFGPGVVGADGAIDRPALAAVVFADPAARADLEAITHPAVGTTMAERLTAQAGTDHVVILDIPLLVEGGRHRSGGERPNPPHGVAAILVVDTPPEIAVERVVADRAMEAADVRARMSAQATREERLARADLVIDNSGSHEDLAQEVDRAWAWIQDLGRRRGQAGRD